MLHKTWRAEVGAELPDTPLPLGELRERHAAWLTCEYHRRVHGTAGNKSLEHFLSGADNLRPVPRDLSLEEVFLHREDRKVRSDVTVRWGSDFYEVPGEYVGQKVWLRHAPLHPERPPLLYVDGRRVCEVFPLDRLANNKRPRRDLPRPEPAPRRSLKGPLDYITDRNPNPDPPHPPTPARPIRRPPPDLPTTSCEPDSANTSTSSDSSTSTTKPCACSTC